VEQQVAQQLEQRFAQESVQLSGQALAFLLERKHRKRQ
jgi:hypothetical protein